MKKRQAVLLLAFVFFFLSFSHESPVSAVPIQPELTVGEPVTGTLSGTGDIKYYQVTMSAGQRLTVILDGVEDYNNRVHTLFIRFGALPTLTTYDDTGDSPNADQVVEIPNTQAGIYYIMLSSTAYGGGYSIVAHTSGTFPALILGTAQTGNLQSSTDIKYYQVTMTAGQRLTVILDGVEDYNSRVHTLFIRFGALPTLTTYDDTGDSPNADQVVEIPNTQAGIYYIMLSSTAYGGGYSIVAHTNGTFPALTLGTAQTGNLQSSTDIKYYQVAMTAGQRLTVILDGVEDYNSRVHTLFIRFGALPTLTTYDDTGDSPNADQVVEIPNTQAGIYYIMLSSTAYGGGYSIVAHTSGTFPALILGTAQTGNLQSSTDIKYYQVAMTAGQRLTVILDGVEDYNSRVHTLFIRFGALPTLKTYDDTGDSPNADQVVEIPNTQAGIYYIMLSSTAYGGGYSIVAHTSGTFPALILGTAQTGNLQSSTDIKYYQVAMTAGQHLTVILDGEEDYNNRVHTLFIRFGALPTLTTYDDTGDSPNADQVVEIPNTQAGIYYIMLSSTAYGGGYSIVAHTNGTFPALTLGTAQTGNLQSSTDIKYYQVAMTAGQRLTVILDGVEDYNNRVHTLFIRFGALPTLTTYDDTGDSPNADQVVEIPNTQAGIYYIMLSSTAYGGGYSIVAHTSGTFPALILGTAQTGNLQSSTDIKYYQVTMTAGQRLTVILDGVEDYNSRVHTLFIRFGALPTLTTYDDTGDSPNADQVVEIPNTQAGIYYIMLSSTAYGGGYSIVAHTSGTFPALTLGTAQTGNLQSSTDIKYYQVAMSAGKPLIIVLDGADNGNSYTLFIKFGALPTLLNYDDKGDVPGADQSVQIASAQAGTYYIMLRSIYGGGKYTIASVNPTLALRSWGPTRVSPGQTVDYASSYSNLTGMALPETVLVAQLPADAEYTGSSAGGLYWAQRHQVVWKLGDLPARQNGSVSVQVRYTWGLPNGQPEALVTLAAARNLPHAAIDLDEYLAFNPVTVAAQRELTADAIADLLTGDPQLKDLFDYALELGFLSYDTVGETTLSDGSTLVHIWLLRPQSQEILTVMRRGQSRLILRHSMAVLSILDRNGGISQNTRTGTIETWGLWQPPSATDSTLTMMGQPSKERCMFNCILPNWALSIAAEVSQIKWAERVLVGWDCLQCTLAKLQGDPQANVNCVKCLHGAFNAAPIVGTAAGMVIDAMVCEADCQANPTSHACTKDKVTCGKDFWSTLPSRPDRIQLFRCGMGGFYDLIPITVQDCWPLYCVNGQCVWDCDPLAQQTQGVTGQRIRQATSVFCALGSASCASSSNSTVAIARDPNAKHGPAEVLPGEMIPYVLEYENEGAGIAYGVYVQDNLPMELDESSLIIENGGSYTAATRSIMWPIGELQPGQKGKVSFQARVRSTTLSGTRIINTASVFFPSVPEETPTNPVVSVVGTVIAHAQSVETSEGLAASIQLSGATVSTRQLTYRIVNQPLNGTVSGTPPNVVYSPADNFEGLDRFNFVASDGAVDSAPAVVTILVKSGPETIAPQVVTTTPLNGTLDVLSIANPVFTNTYPPFIQAAFSEPLDPATVTLTTLLVLDDQGRKLPGKVEYDPNGYVARFLPAEALKPDTRYIVTITSEITDSSGNHLAQNLQWWFHTKSNQPRVYLPLLAR